MSFDHERPTAGEEWELTITAQFSGATVSISKVGGGTIGQSYAGHWHYRYQADPDAEPLEGSSFYTGLPYTHEQAAELLADILEDDAGDD